MSNKQAAIDHLIQTLHSLRSNHKHHLQIEQPNPKRIKIQAAPDGSVSLVLIQANHQPPTTIAPASLFSSPGSAVPSIKPSLLRSSSPSSSSSIDTNQHSPLISATTRQYGRVIMKKDALINKIGLEAAQRAIRKATRQRHRPHHIHPSHPSSSDSSSSTPPGSPHTARWRAGTIAKWLESADDESEDHHQPHRFLPTRDLIGSLSKLANPTSSQALHSSAHPQSLSYSPAKPQPYPSTRYPPASDTINSHQQILNPLGHTQLLSPLQRPTTPPNQQSFFRTEELNIRAHRPFSQLSFGIQPGSGPSSATFERMLKPGCNLSQAFLLRPPSPTIPPCCNRDPMDENRSPSTFSSRPSSYRPSPPGSSSVRPPPPPPPPPTNDFSPCSPLRNDLRTLVDHQHASTKLDSSTTIPSAHSPSISHHHHHRWLTDRDPNSPFFFDSSFPDNPFLQDTPLDNFLGSL